MNIEFFKQFIKFGVVGTIGAVVDFSTYNVMTRLFHWDSVLCTGLFGGKTYITTIHNVDMCTGTHYPFVSANMVSVFLAITSNFFLNKYWTFRDRNASSLARQGMAYFTMSIFTWILNQLSTGLFLSRLPFLHTFFGDLADQAAKALAIFVVLFFNFAGSKIIFRKKSAG